MVVLDLRVCNRLLKGLQKSFIDVLQLDSNTGVFPENAQYYVAYGAALYAGNEKQLDFTALAQNMQNAEEVKQSDGGLPPLFSDEAEYNAFKNVVISFPPFFTF